MSGASMKTRRRFVVSAAVMGGLGAVVLAVSLRASYGAAELSPIVVETLTQLETEPSTSALQAAFGSNPAAALASYAVADPAVTDPGVVLRAVRALANYPTGRPVLRTILLTPPTPTSPPFAFARARIAVEALAVYRLGDDVALLATYLNDEQSPDLRAAAATAMGTIASEIAVEPLRTRFRRERVALVQVAITRALAAIEVPAPPRTQPAQ